MNVYLYTKYAIQFGIQFNALTISLSAAYVQNRLEIRYNSIVRARGVRQRML